ncbi:SAV_2336 N-terminal domain-related protein [Streptomyces xinghaiensis]|uniref:Protein kinase domain-containing protein n=3 Tax=Streptomyces TaxID=1883 RepID=A0A3M8ESU3_9ACTN|nr:MULTISPECIES: SAV_2336 N-terminal domain-related protein [Streptomyces]PQM19594.1 hypothetical protein Sfr7A_31505 [Streptomyces xinghaiensis]RKM90230.1 hypothetical protein SFRA_031905 [Streptomyces xinghaiensis]RNC69085.1 hypothetical protein DC095_030275 [Streptomyces xinghaiensis]
MPEEALGALAACGIELSTTELLEVLWLASRLPTDSSAPVARALGIPADAPRGTDSEPSHTGDGSDTPRQLPENPEALEDPEEPSVATRPEGRPAAPRPVRPSAALHATAGGVRRGTKGRTGASEPPAAAPPEPAMPVRVPEDKAFGREAVRLSRALRPFKQRHPGRRREFDLTATVAAMAETGLPDVVERPAAERWLDLSLVVDDGVSMLLWRRLATELRSLLQRLGAFRDLRVYGLNTRGEGPPRLRGRPFDPDVPTLSPTSLIDSSGRRLTLIVSDGVGTMWRDGRMDPVLGCWALHGPTAVIHALPRRMWAGSGISTENWRVTTRRRGAANHTWQVADPLLPPDLAEFGHVPVPVLEPRSQAVDSWARLVTSPGARAELPLLVPVRSGATGMAAPGSGGSADAARTVLRFRETSTPEAYRLAAHLAAVAPVSVPVMRLVQQAVPWTAETAHLAEVFLGGLMRHTGSADRLLPPQHRAFDFVDGVRGILLDTVPPVELLRTSRTVAERLARLVGVSPDFPAWLAHPGGSRSLSPAGRPFAWLDDRLMTHLGASPATPEAPAVPAPAGQYALPLPPGMDTLAGWHALRSQDPQSAGRYTLRMRKDVGRRAVAYVGEDRDGERVIIRFSRQSDWVVARELLGIERNALLRMDGRYAPAWIEDDLNEELPWLALELATTEGGDPAPTLRAVAQAAGWFLDPILYLRLGLHLAHAVSVCHLRNVVHGALTPDDVLVTERSVQIINWVSALVDGASSALPQSVPVATPYRAPEVSHWSESRTRSSDVYSVGVMLVEAATGWTWRHFQRDILRRDIRFSRLDGSLRELLLSCMDPDPARRPTARQLAEEFAEHLPEPVPDDTEPDAAPRDAPPGDPPPPAAHEQRTDDGGVTEEARRREFLRMVRGRLHGPRHICVLAPKTSMGCTSATAVVGALVAEERRERVLSIDADDNGQIHLDRRVYRSTPAVLADLARSVQNIEGYEDLRLFLSEHRSGLAVLANAHEAHQDATRLTSLGDFSTADFQAVCRLAERHFRIVLTDLGRPTEATAPLIGQADRVLIAATADAFGVQRAGQTLDELADLGYPHLVPTATIALLQSRFATEASRYRAPLEHVRSRCRGAVVIPWDSHLNSGSALEMSWIAPETHRAFLEIAALLLSDSPG